MGKFADTFEQIVKTMKEGDEIFQLNIKEVEESVKAIAESENKLIKDWSASPSGLFIIPTSTPPPYKKWNHTKLFFF